MKNCTHLTHLHVLNYVSRYWFVIAATEILPLATYITQEVCSLHMKFDMEILITIISSSVC
jgi:hypothetical protein